MSTPISFNAVTDWVDYTDPTNVPTEVRILSASDLLRYENFGSQAAQRINEHDTAIGTLQSNQTQNVERLDAIETLNTTQGNAIDALQQADTARQTQITNLTRTTLVRASTSAYTILPANRIHIHTAGSATYTLPSPSTNTGVDFIVFNKGAGTLTLQSASGSQIFNANAAVATLALTNSQSAMLVSDGTHWIVVLSKGL